MIPAFIKVWKRVPKKAIGTVVVFLILYFGERLLDFFLVGEEFHVIPDNLKTLLWVIIAFLFTGLLVIFYHSIKIIAESLQNDTSPTPTEAFHGRAHIKDVNEERLPSRLEIDLWKSDEIAVKVLIPPRWVPANEIPSMEDFISAIEISDAYCGSCESDFTRRYTHSFTYYSCPNHECHNRKECEKGDIYELQQKVKGSVAGKIRNDFKKYWSRYKDEYEKYTT